MANDSTSLNFIRSRIAHLQTRAEHYRSRRASEAFHFVNEELQQMIHVEKDLLELQKLKNLLTTKKQTA